MKIYKITITKIICKLFKAHCTVGRAGNSINVVVGTHFLNSGGVAHRSNRIVNHPSYNANTIAFDVSVVETATTIAFTTNARAIAMNSAFIGGGVTTGLFSY